MPPASTGFHTFPLFLRRDVISNTARKQDSKIDHQENGYPQGIRAVTVTKQRSTARSPSTNRVIGAWSPSPNGRIRGKRMDLTEPGEGPAGRVPCLIQP